MNVSPAKTEVHFLEPSHVRAFIIKTLRETLSKTLNENSFQPKPQFNNDVKLDFQFAPIAPKQTFFNSGVANSDNFVRGFVAEPKYNNNEQSLENTESQPTNVETNDFDLPLGRVIGQLNNKYILAENASGFVIVDQHAAHERITYEKLRKHEIKTQPLLAPIVINMRGEDVESVMVVADELKQCGLHVDAFGDNAIAVFEKPSDWDLNWEKCLQEIADEVRAYGHSSRLNEKLHLKLANYACHHSVRSGRKLNMMEMDALLREIERTERGGECNHGRPVYKVIPISELDSMFERI